MHQSIKAARQHANTLIADYRDATARYLRAKSEYEAKEAEAFIDAKVSKVSDELAKRIALLKTTTERAEMDAALEDKRVYKLDGDIWKAVFEALTSAGYSLQAEIKLANAG
jgi:hypothetical protein